MHTGKGASLFDTMRHHVTDPYTGSKSAQTVQFYWGSRLVPFRQHKLSHFAFLEAQGAAYARQQGVKGMADTNRPQISVQGLKRHLSKCPQSLCDCNSPFFHAE